MFVTNKVCGKVNDRLVLVSLRNPLVMGREMPQHICWGLDGLGVGRVPTER